MKFLLLFSLATTFVPAALANEDLARAEATLAAPHEGDPFAIAPKDRLTLAVPHTYARAEAMVRLTHLLEYWKKRFDISSEWRGERVFVSGKVLGVKIQALFAIEDSAIVGVATDPGWPLRDQVMSYVDKKLKKYLHPTYEEL